MSSVVLVTGVSRDLGARVARSLASDPDRRVIGLDLTPPEHDFGGVLFVSGDLRGGAAAGVLATYGVEVVVHMAMVATPSGVGGRSSMKEINVLGTMQLLAACQRAGTFRKLVVQNSVSVYGASPRDPAVPTDELPPGAAEDPMTVFDLTDQVRETIQQSLHVLLEERGGPFLPRDA